MGRSEMETTLIEKLALSVIQRIDVRGIKGKARDREVIALFVGAALAMRALDKRSENLEMYIALVLQTRGYGACLDTAAKVHHRYGGLPVDASDATLIEVQKRARRQAKEQGKKA
jgi:hypothetical protein